jgi:hypothetical protein
MASWTFQRCVSASNPAALVVAPMGIMPRPLDRDRLDAARVVLPEPGLVEAHPVEHVDGLTVRGGPAATNRG